MKITNMRARIKSIFMTAVFCLIVAVTFLAPSFMAEKTVRAAGNLTFTAYSNVTQIKTNATNKDVIVYGVVSNNSTEIFGAQFTINVDKDIFEFKEYMTPTAIATELKNPGLANTFKATENKAGSNKENGNVKLEVHDNGNPITVNSFVVGGYKLSVKEGATLSGNSAITIDTIGISDMKAKPIEHNTAGTNITISFAEPSSACEITGLTSTQNGVSISKDGNNYKAEVPYSVTALNTSNLKPTVSEGATVTYSPSGNVALTVGQTTTIAVKITAEDGKNTKSVNLNVTRKAGEEENTLSALAVKNAGTDLISKSGADLASSVEFSIEKPVAFADRDKLSVVTSKNGTYSTVHIKLDGSTLYSGKNTEKDKTLNLSATSSGEHTLTVTVTSETGNSTQYTVKFTVEEEPSVPIDPIDPIDPNEPGAPDENGDVLKPTLNDNPTFTGKPINVQDLLIGFNSKYMELSGADISATKAGTYHVTISLKNADYHWKENVATTAKNLGFAVTFSDGDSFTLEWKILPYSVPASSWKEEAGKAPVLADVPADILAYISFVYQDKNGETVSSDKLVAGETYTVSAVVQSGFEGSVEFAESVHSFTFNGATNFFTQKWLGLAVWIWFVIALAVLLLIIVLITGILVRRKKNAARREKEKREEERRREEERLDRLMAMNNGGNNRNGVGMPVMPVGMQQPVQPAVSSEQLIDIKNDLKQELRDLRQELKSQPAATQPVAPAQPTAEQPTVIGQPVIVSVPPVQAPAVQPEPQIKEAPPVQPYENVSAEQIKDEVKGELKDEFGHQARVERFLGTIAASREQDRQKMEQEEQERNERLQSIELRRKERMDNSVYYHGPYDPSAERVHELEAKLRNMEELMWMMRYGGMQQQSPQMQLTSASDERVRELEAKVHELEEKRDIDDRLKEIEWKQAVQRENEQRAREEERKLHEMEIKQMELMHRLEEERRRNEEERKLRELEERLRREYSQQSAPVTVQTQIQKSEPSAQPNLPLAEKPVVVVQQPAPQTSAPQPTVQPGSVMTTTTTTTIDATKDAKVDDLPDYSTRFSSRRRS